MLRTLFVAGLAIVREVQLDLEPGLTVLTGETGAGKSILVDALGLLLGARASADLVRSGSRAARVEGIFRVADNPEALATLEELGLEPEEGEVILAREVSAEGRGKVFINGSLNTLGHLKQLGSTLVDIHGQHEHIRLLEPRAQLAVLDAVAAAEQEAGAVQEAWTALRALEEEARTASTDDRERAQRLDILAYQVREIEQAAPQPGEDEELERERRILDNAQRVLELAEGSYQELYEREDAVVSRLAELERSLAELASFEPGFEKTRGRMESARYELEDMAYALRDYARGVSADPERQAVVLERLELLSGLEAKYGASIADVLAFAASAREEMESLLDSDRRKGELERRLSEARACYARCAGRLSELRREAAEKLQRAMSKELEQLAMGRSRFMARVAALDDAASPIRVDGRPVAPGPRGVDRVEFLLAANPGEPPRPLAAIASGGELARVQLALGSVGRGRGAATTSVTVYDEVDAGVSGRVGDAVGRKLRRLARGQQVLCVTHLAQVAAHAEQALGIRKLRRHGRTEVAVEPLDGAARIEELARMLGGARVTDAARRHAAELLAHAGTAR